MKIPTLLFAFFLLNISTICICTKLPAENFIYPSQPNEQQSIGENSRIEDYSAGGIDLDKITSEDFSRLMELIEKDIQNRSKVPAAEIGQQQTKQFSNLNKVCIF